MKFIIRNYPDCYEELIRYYPRYYIGVREMEAILHAHGRLLDSIYDGFDAVYSDNFVDSMDEEMLTRLENFLGITLDKSRTLEDRRRIVKAYLIGNGKISASMIEEIIHAYTGADVKISFEPFDEEGNNMLIIDIARGDEYLVYMSDILWLLEQRIPAHIYYRADLWYEFPGIVIGGGRKRRTYNMWRYPLAGTLPDTSTLGMSALIAAVIEKKQIKDYKSDYLTPKEEGEEAGVLPYSVEDGVFNKINADQEAVVSVGGIGYRKCGDGFTSQG